MTALVDGFLTKEDFVFLYERNPFSTTDPVIDIRCSAAQGLLSFHNVGLVDGSKWLVQILAEGPGNLWPPAPTNSIAPAPATNEWECLPPDDAPME
jgi:hypothetical protein